MDIPGEATYEINLSSVKSYAYNIQKGINASAVSILLTNKKGNLLILPSPVQNNAKYHCTNHPSNNCDYT